MNCNSCMIIQSACPAYLHQNKTECELTRWPVVLEETGWLDGYINERSARRSALYNQLNFHKETQEN